MTPGAAASPPGTASTGRSPRTRLAWLLTFALLSIVLPQALLAWLSSLPAERWAVRSALVETQDVLPGVLTTLPDVWHVREPPRRGTARYVIGFDTARLPDGPLALFIPRASLRGDIHLNGMPLSEDRNGTRNRAAGSFNRAAFAVLPPQHLVHGPNTIWVDTGERRWARSGLSQVYIGPSEELYWPLLRRWLLQEELLRIANLVTIAVCLPMLFIWLGDRRHSAELGLFAAGAILFAVRNYHTQIDEPPIPAQAWRWLIDVSIGWAAVLIGVFVLRYGGHRHPIVERAFAVLVASGTVCLGLLPERAYVVAEAFGWRLPIFVMMVVCVFLFARQTLRSPSPSRLVLLFGLLAQVGPALHDLLWLLGILPFATVRWFPFTFIVLLLTMALVLAREFAEAKVALRDANTGLEKRIGAAKAELERAYEAQRDSDKELAEANARQRLMRDMHDGIGNHLALLLRGLQAGRFSSRQAADAVESTLDEMHLLIDARSPATDTLLDGLSNLRHRILPKLTAAGIETAWTLGPGAETITLPPEEALQVLRIVQECVTNAVRHGHARSIDFRFETFPEAGTWRGDGGFLLSILDDGNGLGVDEGAPLGGGKGLANIEARAASLRGEFTLTQTPKGTLARLAVPLRRVPAAQDKDDG